ncbi:autotransporter assembly complex protein TamA [Shinella curvata]|uniref:Autotransporter assembly complex protein TamA n=1 Tax=Shinella curvata TaxID=1817964 RepID=A0ABT8XLV2_9HYPH|nr:autotransporter assembly complex family protein [Shinella curvata]MCJ8057117.1 autotransporter assembly complex protein TamA [Shinella curvata]MDO6124704.1 autotransporter assembly complex protein TamA [Shinella curvata]
MRDKVNRPEKSFAFLKAGTALAVAAALAVAPLSASPAFAFEIFGMKFFEDEEDTVSVIDPVNYTLTLNPGTDDDDLKEAIENTALLKQDEGKPVSGDLGLVIKARDDRDRILAALYEQARYGGVVKVTVDGQDLDQLPPNPEFPNRGAIPVTITVEPGPVFTFGEIAFSGDAEGRNPADYGLVAGARADSTIILKAGEKMVVDLKAEGRPLAKLTERNATADHKTQTVDVVIAAEGGPVAPVGDVGVTGTKTVDAGFVQRYSRINAGQPYSPEALNKAAERLRTLGVFSSVTIREADKLAPDGSLPMTIEVSEGKHRYFGVGAQVSNTDGLGLQGYWGHRNLFGQAESLRIEGSVSRIGESALGDMDYSTAILFSKPGAFGPASTFNASLKASIVDPDAYKAFTTTAAAGVSVELSDQDTVSAGGEVMWSDVEDAFGKNKYLTAAIPIEYVRDTRDDKLNPTEGYRAMINAKPTYEIKRGTFFSSFEGAITGYQALGEEKRFVLAGKVAAGTIIGGNELSDIPATRRFFLGGGGTVRGYGYQEISPRNGKGKILGGRSYVAATAEARIGVTETIGIVPFIDVGTVSTDEVPDFKDIRAGAGIGLRYATPFGPLRLDVAVPLKKYDGGTSFGVYAGIGQSF